MINLMRNRIIYETIVRYALGIIMFSYGLIKILRIQFILPSSIYEEALKNIDGVTLTWAFLGYSPWFSILLGFLEAIPAVLLLFQKTKLLGALLLFPVLINVFFINVAYGFLSYMQLLSGGLLLMNIIILFFHY